MGSFSTRDLGNIANFSQLEGHLFMSSVSPLPGLIATCAPFFLVFGCLCPRLVRSTRRGHLHRGGGVDGGLARGGHGARPGRRLEGQGLHPNRQAPNDVDGADLLDVRGWGVDFRGQVLDSPFSW